MGWQRQTCGEVAHDRAPLLRGRDSGELRQREVSLLAALAQKHPE
jgi:hypothetical protein